MSNHRRFEAFLTENVILHYTNQQPTSVQLPAAFSAKGGILGSITNRGKEVSIKDKNKSFEENRTQLEQRMSVVEQGLLRTGIRVARLGTEETIELLYKMFNPGELEKPIPINK